MIKRPLNARFVDAVLADQKLTTIRDNPWPVAVPIMLYCWSGPAYRSKHIDVAPVVVTHVRPIIITHRPDGVLTYSTCVGICDSPFLWYREGFTSASDMDDWFRGAVKPGTSASKSLMRFHRFANAESEACDQCGGKGRYGYHPRYEDDRCDDCGGTGRVLIKI